MRSGRGWHSCRLTRRVQRRRRGQRTGLSHHDGADHDDHGPLDHVGSVGGDNSEQHRLQHQRQRLVRRRAPTGELGHPFGRGLAVVPHPAAGIGSGLAVGLLCRHKRDADPQRLAPHVGHRGQLEPPDGRVPHQPAGRLVERRPHHLPRLRLQLGGAIGPGRFQGRRWRCLYPSEPEGLRRHFGR